MRIIGGTHRSRAINAPKNFPLRPTTDFAKGSLFNIINNRIDISGTKVLDIFSGTGSISFEFASRGAKEIHAIEKNNVCSNFIKKRASELEFKNINVWNTDVFIFLKRNSLKYNIIFADPPFDFEKIEIIPNKLFEADILEKGGILIIEHGANTSYDKEERFLERRIYGAVNFSIFK
jgi:16S rRNA (guanine(966)-N(2))-methyltransferase RsmD